MKNVTYTQVLENELFSIEEINHYQKVLFAKEVYVILEESYKSVAGGIAYKDEKELINTTDKWKVIFFDDEIVGVVIYKAKKGLKMVAMGIKKEFKKIQNITKKLLAYFFRITFKNSWMEVSEAAEKWLLKNGGDKYLIPNKYAAKLTGKEILELCDDGYHYKREIQGIVKRKVLIGNPNLK